MSNRKFIGQDLELYGDLYKIIGVDYHNENIFYLYREDVRKFYVKNEHSINIKSITLDRLSKLAENGEIYT